MFRVCLICYLLSPLASSSFVFNTRRQQALSHDKSKNVPRTFQDWSYDDWLFCNKTLEPVTANIVWRASRLYIHCKVQPDQPPYTVFFKMFQGELIEPFSLMTCGAGRTVAELQVGERISAISLDETSVKGGVEVPVTLRIGSRFVIYALDDKSNRVSISSCGLPMILPFYVKDLQDNILEEPSKSALEYKVTSYKNGTQPKVNSLVRRVESYYHVDWLVNKQLDDDHSRQRDPKYENEDDRDFEYEYNDKEQVEQHGRPFDHRPLPEESYTRSDSSNFGSRRESSGVLDDNTSIVFTLLTIVFVLAAITAACLCVCQQRKVALEVHDF